MAKRKRLNRRALILLCIIGALVIGVGGWVALKKTGLIRKLFPRDPAPLLAKAQEYTEEGEWLRAVKYYRAAIAAQDDHDIQDPETYYLLGVAELAYVTNDPDITQADVVRYYRDGKSHLEVAVQLDPQHLGAHSRLAELNWSPDIRRKKPELYIDAATKLIGLVQDDEKRADYHFRRGAVYKQLIPASPDYVDMALADFEKAVELAPTNIDYWLYGKVRLLRELESSGSAYEMTETSEDAILAAIAANPKNPEGYGTYAEMLLDWKRRTDAMEQINNAIAADEDSAVGYVVLGIHHRSEGKREEALAAFDTAQQIDPDHYGAYEMKAKVLRALMRFSEATDARRGGVECLERILAGETDQELTEETRNGYKQARWLAILAQGNSLLDWAQYGSDVDEELLEELKGKALECVESVDKDVPRAIVLAPRLLILGRLAQINGDNLEAMELLRQAYDRLGDDAKFNTVGREEAISSRVRAAASLIQLYRRHSRWSDAEDIVRDLADMPELSSPHILLEMAQIHGHYREYEQAERLLERVVAADPENLAAQQSLTIVRIELGKIEELEGDVEAPTRVVQAFINQAEAQWLAGDRDGAIARFEALHQRLPDNTRITRTLVMMYAQEDKIPEARALVSAALERDPENQILQDQFRVLNLSTDEERYAAQLEMADRIEDDYVRAYARARVHLMRGNLDEYFATLQQAMEIATPRQRGVAVEQLFSQAALREKWDIATRCVEIAEEHDLDGLGGRMFQSRLHVFKGEYDEAIPVLRDLLADDPYRRQARMMLGACYLQKNDWGSARVQFEKIFNEDRGYAPAAISMIRVSEMAGNVDEYRTWVERSNRLAPNDPYVMDHYLRIMDDDPEEIIKKREELRARFPDRLENIEQLARLYERVDDLPEAERAYEDLWRRSPNKMEAATALLAYYGRTDQAVKFDQVKNRLLEIADTPQERVSVYVLVGLFYSQRLPGRAIAFLNEAILIDPSDPRPYQYKADVLRQDGRLPEAIEVLRTHVDLVDDKREATKTLIAYLYEAGEYAEATDKVNTLLAEDSDDIQLRLYSALLVYRSGQVDQALEMFAQLNRDYPDTPMVLIEWAEVHREIGDLESARDHMARADRLASDPVVTEKLATIYLQMGNIREYEGKLLEIRESRPSYASAIRLLAELWTGSQRWTRLTELLEDARTVFPGDPSYWNYEVAMWRQRGDLAKAAEAAAEAWGLADNDPDYLREYLLALLDAGQNNRAYQVAEEQMDRVDLRPWLKAVQARALAAGQQIDQAEALFQQAIQDSASEQVGFVIRQYEQAYSRDETLERLPDWVSLRADDPAVRTVASTLFRGADQLDRALPLAREAAQLAEGNETLLLTAHIELGQTCYNLGDFAGAETSWLKVLELHPNNPFALNNLAYMYVADLNTPEKALPLAKRVAALMPTNASILDTYGWALAQTGSYADAVNYLQRAVSLQPTPGSRYHLGRAEELRGYPDLARRQYEMALELMNDLEMDDAQLRQAINQALQRVQS